MTARSIAGRRAMREVCLIGVLFPLFGSIAFLLLGSLIPVRLDARNFQDQFRASGLALPSGVPYLYVSLDTGVSARHFFGFALHNLAFPSKKLAWVVPVEARDLSSYAAGIDRAGRFVAPGGLEEGLTSAAEVLRNFVDTGVILYDSEAARTAMLERVPALDRALRSGVLAETPHGTVTRRRIASEFSLVRLLRVASMIGLASCLGALALHHLRKDYWGGVAALALGTALCPPVLVWAVSWAQVIRLRAPGVWPFVAWATAMGAVGLFSSRDATGDSATGRFVEVMRTRKTWFAGAVLVFVGFVGVGVLRNDFDEDAHSHWLLMARSYFESGRHVPESLTQHPNSATYPYAYAALMAISAWAADTPPGQFFKINSPTALAILWYRVCVSTLGLASLCLLAWALRSSDGGSSGFALVGSGVVLALFPILQGRHHAAETVLFPLLLGTIVLVESSLRLGRTALLAAALFLAGSCTLVKLEGGLLVLACVAPWMFVRWPDGKGAIERLSCLSLLVGLVPTVIWRATLRVPDVIYRTPSVEGLLEGRARLGGIYREAFRLLLVDGWLPLIAVVLPLAWWRWARYAPSVGTAVLRSAVPVATLSCVSLFPLIYVFSELPPIWQLSVSYGRLLMPGLFGATYFAILAIERPGERGAAG